MQKIKILRNSWGQKFQTSPAMHDGARPVFEEARK